MSLVILEGCFFEYAIKVICVQYNFLIPVSTSCLGHNSGRNAFIDINGFLFSVAYQEYPHRHFKMSHLRQNEHTRINTPPSPNTHTHTSLGSPEQ